MYFYISHIKLVHGFMGKTLKELKHTCDVMTVCVCVFPQAMGLKVGDWVLSVNGMNVRHKSHEEVVAMVKDCEEELTIEVATPT